ncbi:MAG: hypothetical protein O6945_11755 [Gammaproteobacteria bacterium]|nr:hypothetical protein [Gammaproteobacteria bacterium]
MRALPGHRIAGMIAATLGSSLIHVEPRNLSCPLETSTNMLINLLLIAFIAFTSRLKTAITSNAPVSAPVTALQLLERAGYSASLCLVTGTLTGTLHAIQPRFLG